MDVEPTGMKSLVKFGDSRSNRSRDIRLPHFVTNDNDDNDNDNKTTTTTQPDEPYGNRAKRRVLHNII